MKDDIRCISPIRLIGTNRKTEDEKARYTLEASKQLFQFLLEWSSRSAQDACKNLRAWRALRINREALQMRFTNDWYVWVFWVQNTYTAEQHLMRFRFSGVSAEYVGETTDSPVTVFCAEFWALERVDASDCRRYLFSDLDVSDCCLRRVLELPLPRGSCCQDNPPGI